MLISAPEQTLILKKAILKTIAFFDLFDYPLTSYELWRNLEGDWEYQTVRTYLNHLLEAPGGSRLAGESWSETGQKILEIRHGFYFLPGRREIVSWRQKRHNYSAEKVKIARRFARVFSWLPWVQAIFLANSQGFYNLRAASDIDFFIISSPGRLWLSRLYCTGFAQLLRRRPTPADKRNKICLSFYLAADHLNIDDLRLSGADPYFDYWRRQLILLYNKNNTYNNFLKANRLSLDEGRELSGKTSDTNYSFSKINWRLFIKFFDFFERLAKRWQLKIMPAGLKEAAGQSDGVVISDQVLKFYQGDRRREYAKKYEQKIREIS